MKKVEKRARKLADRYRVAADQKFRLEDCLPADTAGLTAEDEEARESLQHGVEMLAELQNRLYAQNRWGVLVIFQAMDAAGKDSTIKHVMSGVNPQGVQVYSFKVPSSEELDHDFLWRSTKALPERGRIGIFNRSYYEEVLVARVHPQILEGQRLPEGVITKNIWEERYRDINAYERYLSRNGYLILKFFLNVSKKEQKRRFLERLERPEKNWKFSMQDVEERACWNDYMKAYRDAIAATSTDWAPWYAVPADHKWFTRLVVAATIVSEMQKLDLRYPQVDKAKQKELQAARRVLIGNRREKS
ncbi:MAG: polyphosphate kinase 2 family protein [Acidobacteriota bacterium]